MSRSSCFSVTFGQLSGARLLGATVIFLLVFSLTLPIPLSASPGDKKWERSLDVKYSSPAIGSDGTIYIGTRDGNLHALDSEDGSTKWKYPPGSEVAGDMNGAPAIGSDGTIYIGSHDGNLYAINPDGSEKWKFPTDNNNWVSSPAVGQNGIIYFGTYKDVPNPPKNQKFYAVNPEDGDKKWAYQVNEFISGAPAIDPQGTIYFGTWGDKLYALNPGKNPSKRKKWDYSTGGWVKGSPAIGNDGTVYVGSYNGKIHAINPDGSKKWSHSTSKLVWESSPVIGPKGRIYIGTMDFSGDGRIEIFDQEGNQVKTLEPDPSHSATNKTGFISAPAIGDSGIVHVNSSNDKFFAINPDTEKTLWATWTGSDMESSPAIGSDGTVYVGATALNSDSNGLAETPWPMLGKDLRHTGYLQTKKTPDLELNPDFNFSPNPNNPKANILVAYPKVKNIGEEKAEDIEVSLKNVSEKDKIDSVIIGPLDAGESSDVVILWKITTNSDMDTIDADIENQNIEMEVTASNEPSSLTDNNSASKKLSIYFAGSPVNLSPFALDVDAYSFENWDMSESTKMDILGELWGHGEGIIYSAFPDNSLIWNYAKVISDVGGHCYGMSATSILYKESPDIKPVSGVTTYNMDKTPSVVKKIVTHQRKTMDIANMVEREGKVGNNKPEEEYSTIREYLKKEDKPIILGLYDQDDVDHAVVGYLAIEKGGDSGKEKSVYVYNNSIPYSSDDSLDDRKWVTEENISFDTDSGEFDYFPYDAVVAKYPGKSMDEVVSSFLSNIKEQFESDVRELKRTDKGWVTVNCGQSAVDGPSEVTQPDLYCETDLVIEDPKGQKVGYIDGKEVNQIPSATVEELGGLKNFTLPAQKDYSFNLSGKDEEHVNITILWPGSPVSASFYYSVPLTKEAEVNTEIGRDLENQELEIDTDGDGQVDQTQEPKFYFADVGKALSKQRPKTTLNKGYNLISIPGKPQNKDPEETLGDDINPLYMYRWNPTTGTYDGVSNIQLRAGKSYWIYAWNDNTQIDLDVSVPTDYSIDLPAKGWQMVGTPFSINWGDVKVDGTKVKNETSGSSYEGPLEPYGFTYDEEANDYLLAEPDGWSDLGLNGWGGYWIKTTKSDVKLGFDKGDSVSVSAAALKPANKDILMDPEGKVQTLPPAPPMKPSKVEGLQAVVSPTLVRDSGGVTFTVRSDRPVEGLKVEVLTANGKKVWNKDTSKSKLTWDTEGVANGIYLYTVSARVDGKLKQAGIGKLLVLK